MKKLKPKQKKTLKPNPKTTTKMIKPSTLDEEIKTKTQILIPNLKMK